MRTRRPKPYARRWWRGVQLTERTISALEWVERKSGVTIEPSQGSWSGAEQSAGTHTGSGAVDLKIAHLSEPQQHLLDHWMRRAGFSSWIRQPIAGWWPLHLHAILPEPGNSPSAAAQVLSYRAHRNGLRDNAYDPAWRPRIPRRWNHRLGRPVLHPLPGQKLTDKQRRMLPTRTPGRG